MGNRGQTTVEFALSAVVLLTLLFAVIDLGMLFYVNLTMQHAVREGARYAITGQADGGTRREAMIRKIRDSSNNLYDKNALAEKDPSVSVLTPQDTTAYANYSGNPVIDTGRANDIIIVRLDYSWPLLTPLLKPFFPDGKYTFTTRATMKNEQLGP